MSRLELSTPELFGSSTFLNTTRRSSEPGGKIQVTVSDCLAAWGFPTALTSLPALPAVTATLMVTIGLPPSNLEFSVYLPEIGRLATKRLAATPTRNEITMTVHKVLLLATSPAKCSP